MIRNLLIIIFLSMLSSVHARDILRAKDGSWEVETTDSGIIKSLKMSFGSGGLVVVPWHSEGAYAGPAFVHDGLQHTVRYVDDNGRLAMIVTLTNNSDSIKTIENEASLRIGINTVMADPKDYFSVFFPTMLRSEKTHFWGYFETPSGNVFAIASDTPVASWHLNYIGNGHRIATATLDLLNPLPLPERHPQDMFSIAPGETKEWKFFFIPLPDIGKVTGAVASVTKAPMIAMERTTAFAGEDVDIDVISASGETHALSIIGPDGKNIVARPAGNESGTFHYILTAPDADGTYTIKASSNSHVSEASLYVRKPWSWYLRQAGAEARRMQQKPSKHRESWMGFFSEYWDLVYFPDSIRLNETEEKFNRFWKVMVDPKTGFFYRNKQTWSSRPQNTSWMVALLTARYAATGKEEDLILAAGWADFLIDKFQMPDGAFKGYTALTMGAKFLYDLMAFEAPLAKISEEWKARYEKHRKSAEAAGRNILKVQDMGDTEGESTYEDSQAGTAWSLLAMHSLLNPDGEDAARFLKESMTVQRRHECLTQALVPDSRMRGGTLRWWEAQYDVLIMRNMMNSPHAWTMRSQFGAMYLYLLTGNEYYLNVVFNAMSSCVQAINHDSGELRWGFVPDPYIKTQRFVQDYKRIGEGKYVNEVLGEQWIPMISDWWRSPADKVVANKEKGWSCDNDVHEHFRFLAEMFIPHAFVIERPDGSLRTWNCSACMENDKLTITPSENHVTRVHFNMKKKHKVNVCFGGSVKTALLKKGMQWLEKDK